MMFPSGLRAQEASAAERSSSGEQEACSIELSGCTKSFAEGAPPALEPLTITIHSGAVIGLVGPDGAGKTTLLRLLAGLLEPTAGTCRVAGLDPIQDDRELRAVMGYMPQRFGLYEDLSVIENLELYAALRNVQGTEKEEAFSKLLRFTSLAPFTGRLSGKLSGGMKQKLGLACTLLGHPKVLLLDEPGVGVDPISRRELWAMVHELAGDGMLVLWSTSYLDEAEQCRDVLLLNQGKLLYAGPPQKLTEQMSGRCFLLRAGERNKRELQQRAVLVPEVSDAVIQGDAVRVILRKPIVGVTTSDTVSPTSAGSKGVSTGEKTFPQTVAEQLGVANALALQTPPRFEDAFIDLLGGGPSHESALAALLPNKKLDDSLPVIQAQNLTKTFGTFTAADKVTFAVKQGEIFGLLGPNGAGKSTTFRMMCGLLNPTSGDARVLGMDLQKQAGKVRQRLGYMAQKFSLYSGLSVEQNLYFFSGVYGLRGRERKERVREMIDTFALSPYLLRSADELPLGFKQRLALACSLMHRPAILFLDEPTSGVDPLTRREFWLHINSMVEKGVTVMVTTHFMDEAEYCDRIGLVYQGKMIASGSPDDLKKQCKTAESPEPSMEEAFIKLIEGYDARTALR